MAMQMHHRAEELMAQADALFLRGDGGGASSLLAQAAQCEVDAFFAAPIEKVRTRGILAASAVSLFRQAGMPIQAERVAHRFLAEEGVPDETRAGLEDALNDMRAEQIEQAQGRTLTPDRFEWSLKGNSIGIGTAPMALVSHKIDQIQKYATRVVEYVSGEPLRTQQPLSDRVRDSMSLLMSQPMAGSFRFALRLSVKDEQMQMFDGSKPDGHQVVRDPSEVGTKFFAVLQAVLDDDQTTLEAKVPEADYRETFVHLVRNMIPDGRELASMRVTRLGIDNPSIAELTPKHRAPIDKRIKSLRPTRAKSIAEHELVGLLRAVDLNSRTVKLGPPRHQRVCHAEDDFLMVADVLEGMLDDPVRLTGRPTGGTGFKFSMIVPASRDELEEYQQAHERDGGRLALEAPRSLPSPDQPLMLRSGEDEEAPDD